MAMRPHPDKRSRHEPASGAKAKAHGLSGLKRSETTPDLPSFGADDGGVEEATVADADLQKRLAGMAKGRRETIGPFAVPGGWGFHELSLVDYWTRVLDLQRAQMDGTEALSLALSAYDLESFAHLEWIRERFERRYGKDPDFKQAMLDAREARAARTRKP